MTYENYKTERAPTLTAMTENLNNMEDKKEITFVPMNFKQVPPTAPESVRGEIYFKGADMIQYIRDHTDEKGWVNVKMMKSLTKGSIYFIKNEYRPKTDPVATAEYNDTKYKHQDAGVQAANEKTAKEIFGKPMTDDDWQALADQPF